MGYTNSSLVSYTALSPNCSVRTKPITKITPHHMAGNLTVESCGNIFANPARKASSNYGIGTDGRIALYVEEKNRAWTSGNADNDQSAVTMEVANCAGAPNWEISDKAWNSLVNLCVDICQRNGIKALTWTGGKDGSLTCHYMFQATACPGPYMKGRMAELANTVNARLGSQPAPAPQPAPTPTPVPKDNEKFIEEVAKYVNKYRAKYNICVASPIIAQAILESASGTSELATNAQNYFGLKYRANRCPTSNGTYKKAAVEQKADGTYVKIDNTDWFKFPNLEQCVIGYFDFTNIANYKNLKGVTDPETYLKNIKADGYATSQKYVDNLMAVIKKYNLTKYDSAAPQPAPAPQPTPQPTNSFVVRVTCATLNVRKGPSTAYAVVRTVSKGEAYTIVEVQNNFGRLKSGVGWICLDYTERV